MEIDKQSVIDIVENMPDDATMDDLMHELYVRIQVEEGLRERATGKTISDDEFQLRMSKWLCD